MTDIHCHLLPAVDDGAKDFEDTKQLLRIAAADGIEHIVFTPHVRRPWLDRPWSAVEEAFEKTKAWAAGELPDLRFDLGAEFHFSESLIREQPQQLHALGSSGCILLEFKPHDTFERITDGIQQIQMAGYDVLLAHIERYACMTEDIARTYKVIELGARIQVNADDIVKPAGWTQKRYMKKLIDGRLIDCVGSDAHDVKYRRPEMKKAYAIVKKRTDEAYACAVFSGNAERILKAE